MSIRDIKLFEKGIENINFPPLLLRRPRFSFYQNVGRKENAVNALPFAEGSELNRVKKLTEQDHR